MKPEFLPLFVINYQRLLAVSRSRLD